MNKNKFIARDGRAGDAAEAIKLCGEILIKNSCVTEAFVEGCLQRETEYPTGLPTDIPVAIPHCKSDAILKSSICLLRLEKPVKFYRMDSSDEYVETDLVFNIAIKSADNHVEFLQKLMQVVTDSTILEKCRSLSLEVVPKFLEEQIG